MFCVRIAWAFYIIQFNMLGLFIESLIEKINFKKKRYIVSIISSGFIALGFVLLAFFQFDLASDKERNGLELQCMHLINLFYIHLLVLPSIGIVLYKIRYMYMPRILLKQLKIFLLGLVIPKLIFEFFYNNPLQFLFPFLHPVVTSGHYLSIAFSTMIMTYAIYFCARKMMGLRFLNITKQVEAPQRRFNFIDDFKQVLEQLSKVTTIAELNYITQYFFKEAFNLPDNAATLSVRALEGTEPSIEEEASKVSITVENFIQMIKYDNPDISAWLKETKVFIKDEIEFTNFYEPHEHHRQVLDFMTAINADIFIPIYDRDIIIAYIIINANARPATLYNSYERDEMVIYTRYLGNIINLLRHRNLDALTLNEKTLKEELYVKHQEINQYKESLRSFLRKGYERKIGIIFFRQRKFVFGNQTAQELLNIDPNIEEGHPLTQALKKIVRTVKEYNAVQTMIVNYEKDSRLGLSGIPGLENHDVIITVFYPDIADIMKEQLDVLKDPSQWDYLLYLETTKSGQLINDLIPGTGETLLHYKIDLLKIALSKKATLLQMVDSDVMPTVELIHHISLRRTLQVLALSAPEKNSEIAIKLFGLNPLLSGSANTDSLLEKINGSGTLYIENIDHLSLETQNHLAHFMRYGFFNVLRSERRIYSSVRLICSTNKNLAALVEQGTFSSTLYQALQPMTLVMPSLLSLSDRELESLAEGCAQQAIKDTQVAPLLDLNARDKKYLINQRPTSIQELKHHVQQLLIQKAATNKVTDDVEFDPSYGITEPLLHKATKLGKQALKDKQIMSFLWQKFKNQTKIATLLRVNRSSVSRRCEEYGLLEGEELDA